MARRRLPKRTADNTRQSAAGKTVTNSTKILGSEVSSSVKVALLVIIGVSIVGFLFYPDIRNMIDSFRNTNTEPIKHSDNLNNDKVNFNEGKPNNTPVRKKRKIMEDLMEEEDPDDDTESDVEVDGEVSVDVEDVNDVGDDVELDVKSENDLEKQAPEENVESYIKLTPGKTETVFIKKADDSDVNKAEPKVKNKQNADPKNKPSDIKRKPIDKKKVDKINQDLSDDIKQFKAKYQKTIKAKKIFSGGRRIPPVELLHQKHTNSTVKVFLFDEFLSLEECDGLRDAHDRHVHETSKQPPILCFDSVNTLRKHLKDAKKNIKVTPNVFTEGTTCVNASFSNQLSTWFHSNWSYSTAFYPGENKFSLAFAHRVQEAMGLNPENGGKIQLTSYPVGKAYKSHTDCMVDGLDKRDRFATVLVYLSDVEKGGETKFPELGIWAKPRKGRALVWNNMDENGKCDPLSTHIASRVDAGQKHILIRWYYYKNFYSLGKRSPEPDMPRRPAGTPKVSCDQYEMGSCRWYDEWNYDHLLEYERQKLTLI